MQIFVNEDNYKALFELYVKSGVDFDEVETKKRLYIKVGKTRYYMTENPDKEHKMPIQSLGLIARAKKDVLNNFYKLDTNFVDNTKVDIFQVVKKTHKYNGTLKPTPIEWEGVCEQIDINSAYLQAALNMGLMSKKVFDSFFEIETDPQKIKKKRDNKRYIDSFSKRVLVHSKDVRLIALGTLAQDKSIKEYRAGVFTNSRREFNPIEANIFFTIARHVGECMCDIIDRVHGAKFAFVDAIFVEDRYKEQVYKILGEHGFFYKTQKCYVKQLGGFFQSWDIDMEGTLADKPKAYFISPSKTPEILKTLYSPDFIETIAADYAQILKEGKGSEKLRQIVSVLVKNEYGLKTDNVINEGINTIFIAEKLRKHGLLLEDLYKIKLRLKETIEDSFGIVDIIIVEKILTMKEAADFVEKYKEERPGAADSMGNATNIIAEYEMDLE